MCTLPSGWRPPETIKTVWEANVLGECTIGTAGAVTLATANIANGVTDSTNLQSRFGLGYEGGLAHSSGSEPRTSANSDGNRHANGTGAPCPSRQTNRT